MTGKSYYFFDFVEVAHTLGLGREAGVHLFLGGLVRLASLTNVGLRGLYPKEYPKSFCWVGTI